MAGVVVLQEQFGSGMDARRSACLDPGTREGATELELPVSTRDKRAGLERMARVNAGEEGAT